MTEAAIDQRLRRACSNGKKKTASGGQAAVTMYKDLAKRDKMAKMLIAANFSNAVFRRNVTKYIEKEKSNMKQIVAGFYTEHAAELERMADNLEATYDKMSNLLADEKANGKLSDTTKFLHIAVPKSMYAKNAEFVWDDIAFQIACSYRRLELQGFRDCNGKHWHAVCLGLTGDNPFLAKVGHLERSFTRVAKASGEQADAGICWQCLAGTPNIPYENFVLNPEWSYTLFETLPWLQQPPFLRGLGLAADLARAPQELHFDVWHNFHGGLAKHMVASTIAEILPNMEEGNLQQKLDRIFQAYLSWKKQSKLTLHCGRLDAELLGMESGIQVCPEGKWSKFSDSRVLLAFLEFFLIQRRDYVPTQITEEALSGVVSANRCFHLLYEAGFWMPASAASEAGEHGMRFLHAYARLAWFTMSEGRSRFPMVPKSHYLHHSFRALVLAARSCKFVVNALATSVQLDEDFIGKDPLAKLQYLDAADNHLSSIPEAIIACPSLNELWLKGNPVERLQLQAMPGFAEFLERRKQRLDHKIGANVVGRVDLSVCGLD
eukprot:s958_g8.t1